MSENQVLSLGTPLGRAARRARFRPETTLRAVAVRRLTRWFVNVVKGVRHWGRHGEGGDLVCCARLEVTW